MTNGVVLLDKDGVLIENVPLSADPDRMRLMDGAAEALVRLAAHGFRFGVVTNQAGIALGCYPEHALVAVEDRLRAMLGDAGVSLDAFCYCPHHPQGLLPRYRQVCDCRKPAPGLVQRAARLLGVDPRSAWVVGDILDDVEAAHRAGARAILFDTGGETDWLRSPLRTPDYVATTFQCVADIILDDRLAGVRP